MRRVECLRFFFLGIGDGQQPLGRAYYIIVLRVIFRGFYYYEDGEG